MSRDRATGANPYERPSDPAKRHSSAMTDGPDRAPARAMLKAIGFTDDDLAKPIVGVATTWIETMPCNYNQRELADAVKRGVRRAGGTPMEFGTISVSDGVSMNHLGMRFSLVSRELIAEATSRHAAQGLPVSFETGNAQALRFADDTLDARVEGSDAASYPPAKSAKPAKAAKPDQPTLL